VSRLDSACRPKAELSPTEQSQGAATPRRRSWRHGTAGSGLTAITGHDRARGVRMGSTKGRWTRKGELEREEERGSPDHGEAERGGTMTGGGGNAQGGSTWLNW
jgi:hypothetical protein